MERLGIVDETYFSKGDRKKLWKQIEPDKWYNPDFENFINEEIIRKSESKPV
ncbi:MAG: hypothetical protein ACRD8K_01790 [Nitrososphaeraceae archaeon]